MDESNNGGDAEKWSVYSLKVEQIEFVDGYGA